MKGKIKIVVSTKRLRYELNLRRNITIIQGDSASGKTTLIQILSDYLSGRTGPGTEVVCNRKCAVLSGDMENALIQLRLLSNAVVFVDEQEKFLHTKAFARAVLTSDCYFVLITRDGLNMLPYSVNEIYYLKNSGYVDGAAFGADMQSAMHAIEVNPGSYVWAPESFEYLILHSGIIQAEGIHNLLANPADFIESSEYSSWERFFTQLLEDLTRNSIYAYNKKKLNPNYLTKGNIDKIKKLLPDIVPPQPHMQT